MSNNFDLKRFEQEVMNGRSQDMTDDRSQDMWNGRGQEMVNGREQDRWASVAFPALMRKVYIWMALALAITGFTAFGVANSPAILQAIVTTRFSFSGCSSANWPWYGA